LTIHNTEVVLKKNDWWPSVTRVVARLSGNIGPVFALVLVVAIFGALRPMEFLHPLNLANVAGQTAVIAVAAVGMTFVIVSAGIDLSVGSVIALTGVYATMVIAGLFAKSTGCSPAWVNASILIGIPLGIIVGLLTGLACGLLNGSIITFGKLPPFIVTLGMLEIVRGMALWSANGLPVTNLPPGFSSIGNAVLTLSFGAFDIFIPYSLFILVPVALAAGFVLKYTVFGVQVYAVGSNENTARLCGVNVRLVKLAVYMIGGLLAGLAGILHASRLNTGQPSEAIGMELDVIAAVVVGGASLMGGKGTILGSVIGAFIIRFLRNGCVIVGVSPFTQRILIGLIIIAAVLVDQWRRSLAATRVTSKE
jgi:ribose transport system permease protein